MARILIIDDDPQHTDMYRTKFENTGYTVDVAPDGVEGLMTMYQNRPDLILLDILMPKINGLDFLSKLKSNEKTKTIPVVLLTNVGGSEESINKGLMLGAVAYLVKSQYTPIEIVEKVKEILSGYLHVPPSDIPEVTTAIKPDAKKILLVEDDPNLILLYKTKFEITGFQVETAGNGEEGIAKMKKWNPNLVFMDIMMPVLTGSNALIKIKQDPDIRKIPVVMLTNLSGEAEGEACLLRGAVAYLVKSDVTPKEVVAKAQEILGTSESPYDPLSPKQSS